MYRYILVVILLSASIFSRVSAAETRHADSYLYTGSEIGRTAYKGFDGATAISVSVGYSLSENWGIEISYHDFGDKSTALVTKGVGKIFINRNIYGFGRLGYSFTKDMNDEIDPNYQVGMGGIGVGYSLTKKYAVQLAFDLYDNGITVSSIGMQLRFQ